MLPKHIEGYSTPTEGEKNVFRFLRDAARPQKDYFCVYETPIGSVGVEPDFILFGRRLGLVVPEVKDWTCGQIASCNPHHFTIDISGRPEKKTKPDRHGSTSWKMNKLGQPCPICRPLFRCRFYSCNFAFQMHNCR
jgi:hypothetical protein